MVRHASAVWNGDLKGGHGSISSQAGGLSNTPYSFSSRFEEGNGTNPEELIAAAHAGCYAMAFSAFLGNAGFTPEVVNATAHVSLENIDGGWSVTKSHLVMNATIPGISAEQFQEIAAEAKAKCPISRLLNAEISLEATLN